MTMPPGLPAEPLGWLAALLTLATFASGQALRLRLLALAANGAFIGYGALAGLAPVLLLHLALVPVNLWRLRQAWRDGTRMGRAVVGRPCFVVNVEHHIGVPAPRDSFPAAFSASQTRPGFVGLAAPRGGEPLG